MTGHPDSHQATATSRADGPSGLRARVERWLLAEPDEDVRGELRGLLEGPEEVLVERFSGGLSFGTAGLRARVGAGPSRMNRLVVRQAAASFADHLLEIDPTVRRRGVVVGRDARLKSDVFAEDTARVFAARLVPVFVLPVPTPTPVLAWSVTRLAAAGAVMVTASHNPAADNGFKVYLGDGAQIVPPHDAMIAARMEVLDPCIVELAAEDDPLITVLPLTVIDEYVEFAAGVLCGAKTESCTVAYTALCGVGGEVLGRVFAAAGFPSPVVVDGQHVPDGSFPGLPFPNPEEPGVMDEVIGLASRVGADVAIANDPDADRLAVAIPLRDGSWRQLTGDEVGWILADHVLSHTQGSDRLVATTYVSSSLLGKIAQGFGVDFVETDTGFKWLADAARRHSGRRLVFAYEQALGYLVGGRPLDKDGVSAAVVLVEAVGAAKAAGVTLEDCLESIAARFGQVVTSERNVPMPPAQGRLVVDRVMQAPPEGLAGLTLDRCEDLSASGLVRLFYSGGGRTIRLAVRPSGTEPKVKFYAESIGGSAGQAEVGGLLDDFVDTVMVLVGGFMNG